MPNCFDRKNLHKHLKGGVTRPKYLCSHAHRCVSVAELSSAFCSTAGKNLAAVGSLHSLAEAVLLLALELLGLVGTKH